MTFRSGHAASLLHNHSITNDKCTTSGTGMGTNKCLCHWAELGSFQAGWCYTHMLCLT